MKYLGVEIEREYYGASHGAMLVEYRALECLFNTECDVKQYIRKQILALYKPQKTLEWLEEQTGYNVTYSPEYKVILFNDEFVYMFDEGCSFVDKNGNISKNSTNAKEMTPRDFVEKISSGEWV